MKWSLGLIFDSDLERVVLLRKGKTLHVGLWNGIGGKIEPSESPVAGMVRECLEETRLRVFEHLWENVGTIGFPTGDLVHVFATWVPDVTTKIPVSDVGFRAWPNDMPVVIPVGKLSNLPVAPHLEILAYAGVQKMRDPARAPIHIQEVARF